MLVCKAEICHLSGNPIVENSVYLIYIAIKFFILKESINDPLAINDPLTIYVQKQENAFFSQVNTCNIVTHLKKRAFITRLYLRNCKFDKGLVDTLLDLIERHKALSELYIWCSNINDNNVHDILSVIPRSYIKVLFIHGHCITNEFFPLPKPRITFILVGQYSLILQNVTDTQVEYIFFEDENLMKYDVEKIKYIYLIYCNLNCDTAKKLFSICKCVSKVVMFDNTQNFGLIHNSFHQFTMLRCIFFYNKIVEYQYISRVANKLSRRHLSVTMLNKDTLIGYRCREEHLQFAVNTGMKFTTLRLNHCPISNCKENFLKLIEYSHNLWLNSSLDDSESTLQLLESLEYITTIKVLGIQNSHLTKQGIEGLANVIKHNKLQQLYLISSNLDSGAIEILKAIRSSPSLNVLSLSHNNLSEEVVNDLTAAIIANKSLEKIWLNNNHFKSSAVALTTAISKFCNLKELDLSNIGKSDKLAIGIAAIIAKNTHFTSLVLINNNLQSDDIIVIGQALSNISTLKILNFQQNQITDKAAESLASVVSSNTGLEKLGLGNNFLQFGMKVIAKALAKISTLKMLDLNNNILSSKVADDISTIIYSNSSLEKLWLGGSHLGSSIIPILHALKRISSLRELNINNVKGKPEHLACEIADMLERNLAIKDLRLNNNNLNFIRLTKLAKTLSDVKSLEVLDISSNLITEIAADAVADVISSNISLNKIYLSNNQIQNGIKIIAKSLETIYALEILHLASNSIMPDSCNDLANGIKKHPLIELNIAYNNLQSSGFAIIATGLLSLGTLTCLQIDGTYIDSAVLESLKSVIAKNTSLKYISLSDNLLKESLLEFTQACINLSKLHLLNISSNCISPKVAPNLATNLNKCSNLKALLLGCIVLDFYDKIVLNTSQHYAKLPANLSLGPQDEVECKNSLVGILCFEIIKIQFMEYFVENHDMLYWQYANILFNFSYCVNFFNDIINHKSSERQIAQEAKHKLSQIDAKAMISSLQIIKTLKVINLENNGIDEDAAAEFAGHLHFNFILEQLWLRGNELYDKGACNHCTTSQHY